MMMIDREELTSVQKRYYMHRWANGMFDSVSPHFFTILNIYVPTLADIPEGDRCFLNGLTCQPDKYWARDSAISPQDPSPKIMIRIQAGDVQGIREKLDGTMLCTDEIGGQKYIFGPGFTIPVDSNFIPKVMEWTPDGIFTLLPFALPTSTYNGIVFRAHPFSNVIPQGEGAIFLVDGVEYRLKYYPTGEMEVAGSQWECALGESGVVPLRPRYGYSNMPYHALEALPSLYHLEATTYPCVEEITSGPVYQIGIMKEDRVSIDSGFRAVDGGWVNAVPKEILCIDGVYNVWHQGAWKVSPVPHYVPGRVGSKLLLYKTRKGKEKKDMLFLFKDGVKQWDAVGGGIEPGESPLTALLREFCEEVHAPLIDRPTFIGHSDEYEDGRFFRSAVFIAPYREYGGKWKAYKDEDVLDVAPWVERIVAMVKKKTCELTTCAQVWRSGGSIRVGRVSAHDDEIPPCPGQYQGARFKRGKGCRNPFILRPIDVAFLRAGGKCDGIGREQEFLESDDRWPVRSDSRLGEASYDVASYHVLCARRSHYDRR